MARKILIGLLPLVFLLPLFPRSSLAPGPSPASAPAGAAVGGAPVYQCMLVGALGGVALALGNGLGVASALVTGHRMGCF